MIIRKWVFILPGILWISLSTAQKSHHFDLQSPDGKLKLTVETGSKILWSLSHQKTVLITPSSVSMTLGNGQVLGHQVEIISSQQRTVNGVINTPFYKKSAVADQYNQLLLECKGLYGIIFRAYNDGIAYRFYTRFKDEITILSEEASFNFKQDDTCFVPYTRDLRGNDPFIQSFEALYTEKLFSGLYKDSLIFFQCLSKPMIVKNL